MIDRAKVIAAMAANGGWLPVAMVMPTIASIDELDAYAAAYREQRPLTQDEQSAIAHRRIELLQSATKRTKV